MHICVSVYWVVVVAQLVELGCIIKLNKKIALQNNLFVDGEVFFVGWAISRCLSTAPHPIEGKGQYTSCTLICDRN